MTLSFIATEKFYQQIGVVAGDDGVRFILVLDLIGVNSFIAFSYEKKKKKI